MRSRLIEALNNRFYVKFMQLEKGLLSESILFDCTKRNFMDIQKPGPRGRSSSINPGPGAAVECKTPGVALGGGGGGCWCLELTDA